MFKEKVVVLSGDNRELNDRFIERFYDKVKQIKFLTSDIFDKRYDEYEKITLVSNIENLSQSLQNSDYLLHYVSDEISSLKGFMSLHDEFTFNSEKLLQSAIKASIPKVVFVSDGQSSLSNDKMMKNLAVKYANRSKKTDINYVLVKEADADEMIDSALFAIKTMKSGEIFVKKVEEKRSFSSRLKELFSQKSKIQKDRESFFTAEEMSRMIDYGKYYKIAVDNQEYKLNIFADRLKSLESKKEVEAQLESA